MWCSTLGGIVTLTLSLLVAPLAAHAQPATKVYRIGRFTSGLPPTAGPNPSEEAFRQGLHDLGYVEGQTLVIEARYAEGSLERLPELAAEPIRLKGEAIVGGGSPAIRAVQGGTPSMPMR